jgi:hypothetical protein
MCWARRLALCPHVAHLQRSPAMPRCASPGSPPPAPTAPPPRLLAHPCPRRLGGGNIVVAMDRKARDPQRLYAVCPFSMPGELVLRLQGGQARAGDAAAKNDFE